MAKQMVLIRLELDARPLMDGPGQQAPLAIVRKQFEWTGSDADLVELIYGLRAVKKITADGRPADIKDLAEMFGYCFGKELPNVYWTGMVNQKRKKDKTPLLNSMIRGVASEGEEGE
jgi:RteC protein